MTFSCQEERVTEITPLEILFGDEHIVAVNKPPGLLVHRSPIDRGETRFAVQQLRDQLGRYVYPVHRLDRPTSGVLLFAFSGEMAAELGQQFMRREVGKTYEALVRGFVHGAGTIDYALRFRRDKHADKHRGQDIAPQPAVTEYQSKAQYVLPFSVGRYPSARYSLVSLFPQSGRKHQLRRHMAHIRHPIVGDISHGDGKHNKFLRERFGFANLALSCTKLEFIHPLLRNKITIECPRHQELEKLLLEWNDFKHTEHSE